MGVIINGKFLTQKITGVQRYARELLMELDKLVIPIEMELAIPPKSGNLPNLKNIKMKEIGRFKNRLWEQVDFPLYVKRQKGISLNLCNVAPLLKPDIVAIHDVKIKAHPEYFSWKFRIWYELLFVNETKRAKRIITVSEFSKKEIIKYYGVREENIIIIPNAWQHYDRIGFDENALIKYGLKKNEFYFAMGSMEPNKNFRWIAEQARINNNQVFAVAGSINKNIFADGLGFGCPPNMRLLGFVSDEEAKTLMRDCKAFLFPSIYEGFGIPPMEAMSSGCKRIIVSDTDIMHEIFENSVEYINEGFVLDDEKNCTMNNKEVLERFSWKKSASMLIDDLTQQFKR